MMGTLVPQHKLVASTCVRSLKSNVVKKPPLRAPRSEKLRHDGRTTNFERPFTPLPPLRSPRNFGKTRFRRFATFDFLTPEIFFRKQNSNFSDSDVGFSSFSTDFGGSGLFWTSKSSCSIDFASDSSYFQVCTTIGAHFSRVNFKIKEFGSPTGPRPQATGRGRGGAHPPQD